MLSDAQNAFKSSKMLGNARLKKANYHTGHHPLGNSDQKLNLMALGDTFEHVLIVSPILQKTLNCL